MEITREELKQMIDEAVDEATKKQYGQFKAHQAQWWKEKQQRALGMGVQIPVFLTE